MFNNFFKKIKYLFVTFPIKFGKSFPIMLIPLFIIHIFNKILEQFIDSSVALAFLDLFLKLILITFISYKKIKSVYKDKITLKKLFLEIIKFNTKIFSLIILIRVISPVPVIGTIIGLLEMIPFLGDIIIETISINIGYNLEYKEIKKFNIIKDLILNIITMLASVFFTYLWPLMLEEAFKEPDGWESGFKVYKKYLNNFMQH